MSPNVESRSNSMTKPNKLEMWANAQRDGRPLFNAAMFG